MRNWETLRGGSNEVRFLGRSQQLNTCVSKAEGGHVRPPPTVAGQDFAAPPGQHMEVQVAGMANQT